MRNEKIEYTKCGICGEEKIRLTRKDNPHNEMFNCNNKNCVMYCSDNIENWEADKLYQMKKLKDEGNTIRQIAEETKTPKSTVWKLLSTSNDEQLD